MASIRKYRQMWLKLHKKYERLAYFELQRTFHKWSQDINWDVLTKENFKLEIGMSVDDKLMEESFVKIYTGIGLEHGKRVGKDINRDLKDFTLDAFTSAFLKNMNRFLAQYGLQKVDYISQSYKDEIILMFQERLDNGMTIEDAQREIRKIVMQPNFYRYQALRIARTETTSASNFASSQASGVSGYVMEKIWISTLDARTRRLGIPSFKQKYDHYHMNGETVGEKEQFGKTKKQFALLKELMMYPGDPKASAGNIINCRCTVGVRAKRDANGDLIPTN